MTQKVPSGLRRRPAAGTKGKTLSRHILHDYRPGGNCISTVNTKTLTDAVAFGVTWTDTADLVLAAGFLHPAEFVKVVDELRIRNDCWPDALRLWTFKVLCEAGDIGINANMAEHLHDVIDGKRFIELWPDVDHLDVDWIAHTTWHTRDLRTHGLWLRDFAARVRVYKLSRDVLSNTQPIGEIIEELVQNVQR